MAETIFSEARLPLAVHRRGGAHDRTRPHVDRLAEMAMSAPALKARGLTKA